MKKTLQKTITQQKTTRQERKKKVDQSENLQNFLKLIKEGKKN